jgi:signal transduction histidine kinase/CheY-like chemotaxis protein/AraC-like DNA-binding protein/streptogramin lyase
LGSFKNGLRKFSPATKEFQLFNYDVQSIMIDHDNQIWVGTKSHGIAVLNSSGNEITQYTDFINAKEPTQKSVNCLFEDRNNTVWIGVPDERLYYLTDQSRVPVKFEGLQYGRNKNTMMSVSSILADSFGNLWFATTSNGLFYTNFNKNVFKNYLQDAAQVKGLESNVITCFHEDKKGYVWLGTDRNGLLRFNPVDNSFLLYTAENHGLSSNAINEIKGDNKGDLWISTWRGGIMNFDPESGNVKIFRNNTHDIGSLIHNESKSLFVDDTIIWIGTHGEGLAAFDRKRNTFIHYKNNNIFPFQMNDPAWINHVFKDSKNRLWISTFSGLYVYSQNHLQNFRHTSDSLSLSSNTVNMVTEDQDGKIWIITETGGLNQYDETNNDFIHYTEKFDLPLTMKAAIFDDHDRLWISSNEGLIRFDTHNLLVKRFDIADGLNANTFFHKAVLKTKDGKLYFGGPYGFTVFHPDSIETASLPSYFHFENLYIYNDLQTTATKHPTLIRDLSFAKSISLTPEQSSFTIEFAAINLYAPAKTRYAYKLEGSQSQWINLQTERKISFAGLEPGNYTLKIRYTNTNGTWCDAVDQLTIIMLPPWWKTWWFQLLTLLAFFGLVVAIFYIRVASIRTRNTILKAQVNQRTHELKKLNTHLLERNEEITHQKEKLEDFNEEILSQKEKLEENNEEILRQSNKILDQQIRISSQNSMLENTVAELQKLNKTKDHFFSILAHDLKNPVSALLGISDFLKSNFSKLEKKEAEQHLNSAHKATHAVYDLLVNLLNWSQTQSKKIEYTPSDFSMNEIIQKNANLIEQQLRNKHITLSTGINADYRIHADYNMIDVIIRNVMSNSVKFTDYNGMIHVSVEAVDDNVIVCITDTGIGMSPAQIDKLFSLDKQNVSTGTAGETGTGLGLVITQEFLKINNGTLRIESEPGKGSAFYLSLPKTKAGTNNNEPGPDQLKEKPEVDFWKNFPVDKLLGVRGRKLLIIDDNKELRNYLRLILSSTFEIFESENGKEGLKMAQEIQPSIVICDLLMPVMNGLEFCKAVKSTTSTSHIPVVLLTSSSEEESQLAGYEAGADMYLSKPFKKEMLFQIIVNLLQNQEKVRERMRENTLDRKTLYPEDTPINKLDQEFLTRLIDFIEANISEVHIDANVICDEMGISRTALYTKIKTLTGQSVHELIKSLRLKRSLTLLMEGNLNISQIALEVGFNSHSYFNKCFVKQYGLGPREYLKKKGKADHG